MLSALTVGEEVVATLLGIRIGSRYVMVRISNAGDKWSNCSPGRLIIERTMAALHKDGVREFDFSIGNYAYKRRFGVAPLPLVDLTAALSWRGVPYALRDRAARQLRRYPRLAAYLKRALGKPPSREEYLNLPHHAAAGPARIPAHRDPISRHWPRPHRCFAGIRAAPGPARPAVRTAS